MTEKYEFRIIYDFANILFDETEGKNIGTTVKVIQIDRSDNRFEKIGLLQKEIGMKYDRLFFAGWQIIRKYSKEEIDNAFLFHIKIKRAFEPEGEDCGTIYDERVLLVRYAKPMRSK